MRDSYIKMLTQIGGAVIILVIVGCATTAPSAHFSIKPSEQQLVDANDAATVKLEPDSEVNMMDIDKQRLELLIVSKINTKKRENTNTADPRQYEFNVVITRYEKGNAFARFMLAGLGQIHIDAHVTVFALPAKEKYAEFDINKTFAWGGLVGASTKIEDVEPAFAEGIANAVVETQQ